MTCKVDTTPFYTISPNSALKAKPDFSLNFWQALISSLTAGLLTLRHRTVDGAMSDGANHLGNISMK
jgi:hypothetical protein